MVKNGASCDVVGADKQTPKQIAEESGHSDIAKQLGEVEELSGFLGNISLPDYLSVLLKEELFVGLLRDVDEQTLVAIGIPADDAQTILKSAGSSESVSSLANHGLPSAFDFDDDDDDPELPDSSKSQQINLNHLEQQIRKRSLTSSAIGSTWIVDSKNIEYITQIGKGAYGTVYKGIYKGKEVAVKVLHRLTAEQITEFGVEFDVMR